MTAKFRSSGLPPSRITQGQSPPTRRGAGPSFLESRSSPPPQSSQTVDADRPHCALRSRGPHRQEFAGPSRNSTRDSPCNGGHHAPKGSHPMNATEIAAGLSARAKTSAAATFPAAANRADTGPSATQAAPRGARSSCVWRLQAYPENGPTPRPTSMAICSISSGTPVEHRCGGGGPRVPLIAAVHSRKWRQSRRRL